MTITAKFVGTDSLGYLHGEFYELEIADESGISIKRDDGGGTCVYQSLSAFLKNWDNIRVEKWKKANG